MNASFGISKFSLIVREAEEVTIFYLSGLIAKKNFD